VLVDVGRTTDPELRMNSAITYSMIRKSVKRFSEKIMLKQRAKAR